MPNLFSKLSYPHANDHHNNGVSDFKKSIPHDENHDIDFTSLTHPSYDTNITDWDRYRAVFEGGRDFVNRYLIRFSKRELDCDFADRKKLTYVPSHARTSVLEMRNAIFKRLVDIKRLGGPTTYQTAINGIGGGVDRIGSSMNSFMGIKVLTELMTLTRVGVYIDKPAIPEGATLQDVDRLNLQPFLYHYKAEDIRSWGRDSITGELTSVLLRDHSYLIDDFTGLPIGWEPRYRFLRKLDDNLIMVRLYDKNNILTEEHFLELPRIPMVIGEIGESIITDVVDHQIALLNLASSDMSYSIKSNFPFYIEQFDPQSEMLNNLTGSFDGEPEIDEDGNETAEGTSLSANQARSKSISSGPSTGRGYAAGLNAPAFIHPSSEPLKASMAKQNEIKKEIRELVSLSVSGLAEGSGLEAGLAYLGLQLEAMERGIAEVWAAYEGGEAASVSYPSDYQLKSDKERLEIAKEELSFVDKIPSLTYQKEMAKDVVNITLGHKTDSATLKKMCDEIEESTIVVIDTSVIDTDLENGLVDMETASLARGYPKGAVKKAHEERLAKATAMMLAQSKFGGSVGPDNGGARGIPEVALEPEKDAKEEKDVSQRQASEIDGESRTRKEDAKPRQRRKE